MDGIAAATVLTLKARVVQGEDLEIPPRDFNSHPDRLFHFATSGPEQLGTLIGNDALVTFRSCGDCMWSAN